MHIQMQKYKCHYDILCDLICRLSMISIRFIDIII